MVLAETLRSNFALQTAAKPLQIATLLLLTAYRNLLMPYPTVPSPTLYDVPFSHNTNVTDRRQTDGRTSYYKRDRTTQYGRLKTTDHISWPIRNSSSFFILRCQNKLYQLFLQHQQASFMPQAS